MAKKKKRKRKKSTIEAKNKSSEMPKQTRPKEIFHRNVSKKK